jgi:hypothetical protein
MPAATSAGTAAPVPLLGAQQPVDAPVDRRARPAGGGEELDDVGGDVRARRVDELAEIAERQLAAQRPGVVDVERAPPAVAALHAEHPLPSPRHGIGRT